MPILESPRLVLRPLQPGDLEPLAALSADPEVMRYIGAGRTLDPAEVQSWFEQLLNCGIEKVSSKPLPGWLVLTRKEDRAWIGLAALKLLPRQHLDATGESSVAEVGYRLARPYWGQGFATEAAQAIVQFGFVQLQLPRIVAIVDTRNQPSRRVLEKTGLRHSQTYPIQGRTVSLHDITLEQFRERNRTRN